MPMQTSSSGSLDMLLDTMCNTFGGVCFIALMVALLSLSAPPADDAATPDAPLSEEMLRNQELERLRREHDELRAAIAIQEDFLAASASAPTNSLARLAQTAQEERRSLTELRRQKAELEDRLARVTTDAAYSKREAARLERLLADLQEKLGNPPTRQRVVRTPLERKLEGCRVLDLCLWHGRLYDLDNTVHASCVKSQNANGRVWTYTLLETGGYRFGGDAFLASPEYRQLVSRLTAKTICRIWAAPEDFPQLCALRDDLVRRRCLYNWHALDSNTLTFTEGYDGLVQ